MEWIIPCQSVVLLLGIRMEICLVVDSERAPIHAMFHFALFFIYKLIVLLDAICCILFLTLEPQVPELVSHIGCGGEEDSILCSVISCLDHQSNPT